MFFSQRECGNDEGKIIKIEHCLSSNVQNRNITLGHQQTTEWREQD